MSCSANAWSPDSVGALRLASGRLEPGRARLQRREKGGFLAVGDRVDAVRVAGQLGVLRRHDVDGRRDQLVQRGAMRAQQSHIADDAPQDAPQHVARFFVGRRDPVADQHRGSPRMIRDDAKPDVVLCVGPVTLAGQQRGAIEDRPGGVDLIQVVDALQDRRHALEAHAGVDVLRRQLAEDREAVLGTASAALELHEHEVPDLEVALFVRDRTAADAELGAPVVVDLATRPARAWHSHRPEVVGHAAPLNTLRRDADDIAPDRGRLVVVLVNRHPEQLGVEAVTARIERTGQQLPRERDRQFLEVVAEREVAAHLEESRVPRGLSDLVDVGSADYLLDAGRPRPRCREVTAKVGLERLHASNDEQQLRVVGHQRCRRHHCVAALLEELEPSAADLR